MITGLAAFAYSVLVSRVTIELNGQSGLAGDPLVFAERMEELFSGRIPYVDFAFEHLPINIVPMATIYAIARESAVAYLVLFAVLMFAFLYATGVLVERVAQRLGIPNAGFQWLCLTAALLPLVLFRADPVSVMLAFLAVLLAIRGNERSSFVSLVVAVATKGWPIVLVAADWWRGRRLRAVLVVSGTAALLGALFLTPGFRSGREFVGVHQETLSGSVLIVTRLLHGDPTGLTVSAGAVYVTAGQWALLANLVTGAIFALTALTALRGPFSWKAAIAMTATLVYGVLFASPLLSAQFLLWPMAFLAIASSQPARRFLVAASALTIVLLTLWNPQGMAWHVGWLVRNGLLLTAGVLTARDGLRFAVIARYRESDPARNLPVWEEAT